MGILTSFIKSSFPSFDVIKKTIDDAIAETTKVMNEAIEELEAKVSELKKNVKVNGSTYECTVDYNRDEERLSFTLDGSTLLVTVTSDTSTHETSFGLPSNVNTETMTHHYDSDNNQMVFSFTLFENQNPSQTSKTFVYEECSDGNGLVDMLNKSCDKVKQAVALHANGWSFRKIAREIGVSDKTVARWVRNASK